MSIAGRRLAGCVAVCVALQSSHSLHLPQQPAQRAATESDIALVCNLTGHRVRICPTIRTHTPCVSACLWIAISNVCRCVCWAIPMTQIGNYVMNGINGRKLSLSLWLFRVPVCRHTPRHTLRLFRHPKHTDTHTINIESTLNYVCTICSARVLFFFSFYLYNAALMNVAVSVDCN